MIFIREGILFDKKRIGRILDVKYLIKRFAKRNYTIFHGIFRSAFQIDIAGQWQSCTS